MLFCIIRLHAQIHASLAMRTFYAAVDLHGRSNESAAVIPVVEVPSNKAKERVSGSDQDKAVIRRRSPLPSNSPRDVFGATTRALSPKASRMMDCSVSSWAREPLALAITSLTSARDEVPSALLATETAAFGLEVACPERNAAYTGARR